MCIICASEFKPPRMVVWNPIWIKSNLKPVVWTQNKIYFRIKSITRVCRAKSLIGEKVSCFLRNQTLCDFFFFKCSQFFPKSRKLTTFGMLCFTCLRKQEYLYYPKMWCKFRCLNYRYQSDILILNENWHQCEQSIVIPEQIIIQQYIIVLILNY